MRMLQGDQHDLARPSMPVDVAIGAGMGVVAAVLGFMPWIVTGMHLPLQNLWETSVADEHDMPIAFLPFNQYFVTFLAALLLTGAGFAGVAARRLRTRLGRAAVLAVLAALLAVQLGAVVQTTVVTTAGLGMDRSVGTGGSISASEIYVVAFVVGSVMAVLVGVGLFLVLATAPGAVAVVALAVAAVALAEWSSGLVLPPATLSSGPQSVLADWVRWVAPIVVGLGIARTGLHSVGRVVGAVLALVVLLVGPALATAASGAAGMRVLLPYPLELFSFAGGLFTGSFGRGMTAALLAAVIGGVGAVLLRARRRRATTTA